MTSPDHVNPRVSASETISSSIYTNILHVDGPRRRTGSTRRRGESIPAPAVFVPPDIRCQYKGKPCGNERTFRDDGERHSLCELHRQRANANQRRWQKKHQPTVRRRRAVAAQAKTKVLPFISAVGFANPPLLVNDDDGEQDWIDPLFDHLIAKLGAPVVASEPQPVLTRRLSSEQPT